MVMAHTPFPLVKSVPLLSLSHHITHIDSPFHLLHTRGGSTIEIKETLPIRSILFILIHFIVNYALLSHCFCFGTRWIRSVVAMFLIFVFEYPEISIGMFFWMNTSTNVIIIMQIFFSLFINTAMCGPHNTHRNCL